MRLLRGSADPSACFSAAHIDRGNLSSEHGEREGEAPAALPREGATRVPIIDYNVKDERVANNGPRSIRSLVP